jgi:2-C-methyl-D-erythritol 2,4-cyclodiphosphate synthase
MGGIPSENAGAALRMRVGIGYDVHRLVEGRKLVLGGVEIPFERGLLGHSDADVLSHALCDALLGAAGEGDIGGHFPDTDSAYSGISSLALVRNVAVLLRSRGFEVVNVDATILAERPRLAGFIPTMRANLARILDMDPACVNIKAGTNEQLDAVGRAEGIACHAVALIQVSSNVSSNP